MNPVSEFNLRLPKSVGLLANLAAHEISENLVSYRRHGPGLPFALCPDP